LPQAYPEIVTWEAGAGFFVDIYFTDVPSARDQGAPHKPLHPTEGYKGCPRPKGHAQSGDMGGLATKNKSEEARALASASCARSFECEKP